MTTFAGLDVSQAKTTVCIVDERGLVSWRGSCASSPGAIALQIKNGSAACSVEINGDVNVLDGQVIREIVIPPS